MSDLEMRAFWHGIFLGSCNLTCWGLADVLGHSSGESSSEVLPPSGPPTGFFRLTDLPISSGGQLISYGYFSHFLDRIVLGYPLHQHIFLLPTFANKKR